MDKPSVWRIQDKRDPLSYWVDGYGWSIHLNPTEYESRKGVPLPVAGQWRKYTPET